MKTLLILLAGTSLTMGEITLSQLTLTNTDVATKYASAIKSQENLIAEIDMELALRETREDYIQTAITNADESADESAVKELAGASYDAATERYTARYKQALTSITQLKKKADTLGLTVTKPDIITFAFPVALVIAEIGDPSYSQPLADLVAGSVKNGSDIRINAETGTQEVDLYSVIYDALPAPTQSAIEPFKL